MKQKSCDSCPALCCKYIALQIDTPTCRKDWDNIFWYLYHENIIVFIDHDNNWIIEFKTKCKNLQPDYHCGIYETRPKVCRGLKTHECEHHNENSPYQEVFYSVEDLKKYLIMKKIDYPFKEFEK
jgi:uncharacterized protein